MMPKGVEHRGFAAQVFAFVLNAFRHHRNSHTPTRDPIARFGQRAQRLSASSEFAPDSDSRGGPNHPVLNAFRHHRNSHDCLNWMEAHHYPCSTPFGIIGIRTHQRHILISGDASAQRLSASSEFAPRQLLTAARLAAVLNAFRHHRNSHASH